MTKKRLYLYIILSTAAGYAWVLWSIHNYTKHSSITPCLFKNVTGIACPSCGATRSLLEITKGDLYIALMINPLGFVIAAILLIFPFWILYDSLFKRQTLYNAYLKFERTVTIRPIAIILILLVLANWAWNIHKGL